MKVELLPGATVDRYVVEAEIGRGGMARVYRVRHASLGSAHALKLLTMGNEDLTARLIREGQVQAQLDHPGIVAVRDVLDLPQGPGLLMDFIDGPTLDAWNSHHGPTLEEKERVFLEIVSAVDWAHGRGIVHRDLKPGNILMQPSGDTFRPRIADFGLAKVLDRSEDEGPDLLRSRTGRPMGTPAYMSPEQVRSAKHVDARTDVFALGCILYELVCGERAFDGVDTLEVFNRIAYGRYRSPTDLSPDLPTRLATAIRGALAPRAEDRIPDCATLRAVVLGDHDWRVPEPADTFMPEDGSLATWAPPLPQIAPLSPAPEEPIRPPSWRIVGLTAGGIALGAVLIASGSWGPRDAPEPLAPAEATASSFEEETPSVPEASIMDDSPTGATEPAPAQLNVPNTREPNTAARVPPPLVTVRGDATAVRLQNETGRIPIERARPGPYAILATFSDGREVHAGNIELTAGNPVTLDCRESLLSCTP
jgi:serine/threonine protein kinase